MSKITPFLMFNDQLEAAVEFYTSMFPDSKIKTLARKGNDGPITSAEFSIGGQFFMGYNGVPISNFPMVYPFSLVVKLKKRLISIGMSSSKQVQNLYNADGLQINMVSLGKLFPNVSWN